MPTHHGHNYKDIETAKNDGEDITINYLNDDGKGVTINIIADASQALASKQNLNTRKNK